VEGRVASFSIDRSNGSLKLLNTRASGGIAPCHLAVDHTDKILVVANYTTGDVSSYPIESDGSLGPIASHMTAHGSSANKERQEGPHAHETVISANNRRVYVPDLGLDHIRIYRLDAATAKLTPNDPPFGQVEPGRGPRHMAFSHDEKYAYVLNEIEPFVNVFRHDTSNGALHEIQSVETLPRDFKGENTGAEIRLDQSGKYLYTSNRGNDSLQVFAVDPDNGTIRRIQIISTGGKTPRGFAIDPTGQFLFAGNQDSNQLAIFRVNRETGELSDTEQRFEVPSPVDVLFVPAK
jgi:6-phosphogluconolactonase